MADDSVDESHPAYVQFLDCFIRGASLQDIYTASEAGFGVRTRRIEPDPARLRKLQASCRVQFDRVFSHMRNLAEPVDRHVGLQGRDVLDFGAGTGALAVAVALRGARVTAVDPTAVSLEACRWRARYFGLDDDRVRTQAISAQPGLPYADARFDVVICNSVFEFIPDHREAYVRELARVLRPGGHLVVSTENGLFPVDYYTRRWFPLLRRAQMRRLNVPYGMTWFELTRWLRATGRRVTDLSKGNPFNSMDHYVSRRRAAGGGLAVEAAAACNAALKAACRAVGLPSQVFFPYTTFIYRLQ